MPAPHKGSFVARATPQNNEMYIYDQIGQDWSGNGITAQSVADELAEFPDKTLPLDVYVNSPGGSVFDGIAIMNQLKRYPGKKNVHIDGLAASIASVICMAGDTIEIADSAMLMIHKAWGMAMGTDQDMVKYAASLTQVDTVILDAYVAKSGGDRAAIKKLVDAETWLTGAEALDLGLVTAITSAKKAVNAQFAMLAQFKNTPRGLRASGDAADPRANLAKMEMAIMRIGTKA